MYNYNKSNKFTKENKKDFVNFVKKSVLINLFRPRFPQFFITAKNKKELKKGNICKKSKNKSETFFTNEYIYYNTYTFNFFILDIDHKNYKINDFIEILDEKFIAPPNWIVETNSGYQLGFILEKPFNLYENNLSEKDKLLKKYTLYLQKKMLKLLNGDFNACRLKGFWKNPIGINLNKFKLFVNNKNLFNLSDFDFFDIEEEKEILKMLNKNKGNLGGDFHKNKEKIKLFAYKLLVEYDLNILKEVKKGYRNSFLWYIGMNLIKRDPKRWEEKLNIYNINLEEPLGENEMNNIKKSILKYTRQNKNFINLGGYNTWTPELKREYINNYRLKKGIVKMTREQQKQTNKNKVLQSVYKLKKKNLKPSIRNIMKECGLSKNVVNKYVKELKQDPKFSVLFS